MPYQFLLLLPACFFFGLLENRIEIETQFYMVGLILISCYGHNKSIGYFVEYLLDCEELIRELIIGPIIRINIGIYIDKSPVNSQPNQGAGSTKHRC